MNRIARRSFITILLALVLVGGMVYFCYEYVTLGATWATFPGSPHVSQSGAGILVDRSGTELMRLGSGRTYSDSTSLRKAMLHWLGDREGNISAPAPTAYSGEMAGFSLIQGLYGADDAPGTTVMTLSASAQRAALNALGDRKGTVGVYNYETGEILCAVSTPSFDPDDVPDIAGDTTGAYSGAYLNRFTQVSYVPGSIFKVVTTAAALDCLEGIEDRTFTCEGSYYIGSDEIVCENVHGTVTLKQALAKSCNCTFAQVVELLGRDNMKKYVADFGITESQSFDGITTAEGNYDISSAAMVNVAWSGIGQYTDQINACRFMTFMGAIAGGGRAAEPYVISRVTAGEHNRYKARTSFTGRIMPQDVAEILAEYMRNNVVSIYGSENFPGLTVCAKSGTAQLGGDQKPNATFAGFVTDPEYPLAFIVIVENGGSGSGTGVPIASAVLSACKEVLDNE